MLRCSGCPHKQCVWEGARMVLGGNQHVQGGDMTYRTGPAPGHILLSVLLVTVPPSVGLWARCLFSVNR